jgi:FMN reductase [NAD(P)H]
MDFSDVMRRRRMVRNYTDEPVPREVLERIVDRGRRAPSGGFSQGNRFVVVTDQAMRARIAELADEEHYVVASGLEPWITRAPAHIVVAMREDSYHDRYTQADKLKATGGKEIEWRVPWWWVDAGKAIMLLLLAAVDEGLGAGLFGLVGDRNDDLRRELGMPDDFEVVGIVTVGHRAPEANEERLKKRIREVRLPLDEVVRWERW